MPLDMNLYNLTPLLVVVAFTCSLGLVLVLFSKVPCIIFDSAVSMCPT